MLAINRQPNKTSANIKINSTLIVSGVIAISAVLLFAYLMWYVAPQENIEMVKVVAITTTGCIGETMDGFAVNIGECQTQSGDYVMAQVDQKTK